MSDPQIWTVIGLFAATLGLLVSSVLRTMRGEFASVRSEIGGLRAEMNARFESVDAKVAALTDTVDARFDAVNSKLDHLDRDVQFLMRREFGDRDL